MSTDASETRTVTGTLIGNDETLAVSTDVTVSIERGDFYDDGRLVRSIIATFDPGEGAIEEALRRQSDLSGNSVYTAYIHGNPDGIPDRLREEYRSIKFRIDGPDAETISEIDEGVEGMLKRQRARIGDENDLEIVVNRKGESGRGEGHEITATGHVAFADGRELPIRWRNAVDIGHQVFTGEERGVGSELPDFTDAEVDAAVALARENSPITRSMRM